MADLSDNLNPQNGYSEEWMRSIIEQLKSEVGAKEPTPTEEKEGEKPLPTPPEKDEEVIVLNEPDDESGEMFFRQQRYEEELENYAEDHPKNLFPHNFLREKYLPVITVKGKKTPVADFEEVAGVMRDLVFTENEKGKRDFNESAFIHLWHNRFRYEYAGKIYTPHGIIDASTFKHEIMNMIVKIGITKHLQLTMDKLYHAYINQFKTTSIVDPNKIPFKNGDLVLNPDKKGFTFYLGCLSPVPYRFDYNFKNIPNCEEPPFPNFKEWRDGLFEEEDQYTLKQMLGYLLVPQNDAQEAFFIIGKGGTGKSILTNCIITKMLGNAAFPISIGNFFNNQFQASTSLGKLCMIDDDIGETNLSKADSGRFKNFITSDLIQIEQKFCDPLMVGNSARIVCSGNHMIGSDDKSDGFTRRLHPIYTKPRTIENVDRYFKQKIRGEIEMIVLWALEGLLEMYRNGGVPYRSERTITGLDYYTETQKWEEQFVDDCFCYKEDTTTYSDEVKTALERWMQDNMEICGEGPVGSKFRAVTRWLQDEGADKNGYIYKRGLRKGNTYNGRGYVNMALRKDNEEPIVFYDEHGKLKVRAGKKKDNDNAEKESDK